MVVTLHPSGVFLFQKPPTPYSKQTFSFSLSFLLRIFIPCYPTRDPICDSDLKDSEKSCLLRCIKVSISIWRVVYLFPEHLSCIYPNGGVDTRESDITAISDSIFCLSSPILSEESFRGLLFVFMALYFVCDGLVLPECQNNRFYAPGKLSIQL